jgi:hypothetical protein
MQLPSLVKPRLTVTWPTCGKGWVATRVQKPSRMAWAFSSLTG